MSARPFYLANIIHDINEEGFNYCRNEVLGVLIFREDIKNPDDCYWECSRSIDYYIENNRTGISEKQRDQVLLIEEKLPELFPMIQKFISDNMKGNYIVSGEIKLSWIELDNEDHSEISWSIDFEYQNRMEHLVVEMKNWKPIRLSFWA